MANNATVKTVGTLITVDALAKSGGAMTGNITMSGSQTVDGRDLSADGTKLDGIESSATADQTAAERSTRPRSLCRRSTRRPSRRTGRRWRRRAISKPSLGRK